MSSLRISYANDSSSGTIFGVVEISLKMLVSTFVMLLSVCFYTSF